MANTLPFDPKTSEARSSWLAGLTEAMSIVTKQLDLAATDDVVEITLNNLPIDDDDKNRIYQADEWNKLWLTDPYPVILINDVETTENDGYFKIDFLGGSIAFDSLHRLQDGDTVKAKVKHLLSGNSADRSKVLNTIQEQLKTINGQIEGINTALDSKQNTLTFDEAPQDESQNPVTSQGIKSYVDNGLEQKQDNLTFDDAPADGSDNPVKSGGIYTELAKKQDVLPYYSNHPLLRNRYFVGGGSQRGGGQLPINQLGKTEYTGIGYSIDGWNIAELHEGASVKIENDGIIITASSDHFIHFDQQIEHYLTLKGSVVTASLLLADGSLLCTHFPLGEAGNGISLIPNEVYIFSIDALHFCIRVLPQKSIKLRAVNLELGDTQTFAHKEGDQWALNDPPPNYQQELAKCQWHQVVYGGSVYAPIGRFICYTDGTVRIFVDLPTTIRIAPAVRIIGVVRLHPIDGVDMYLPADSAVTYVDACNNTLVFDCPSPGAKQGQTGWADFATADAKLIIDANL